MGKLTKIITGGVLAGLIVRYGLPEALRLLGLHARYENYNIKVTGKALIIATNQSKLAPRDQDTGVASSEITHPYYDFQDAGIDEIYCLSVNDSFVMNAWFDNQDIKNVKALPDGNFEWTSQIGALVEKGNLGFGKRSWRYAMVINDNTVEHLFAEDDMRDLADTDPYEASAPDNVLSALTDSE